MLLLSCRTRWLYRELIMRKTLLPALAGLFLLAGCARNYVIVQNDFTRINVNNKPKYKEGYYYYRDARGQETRISAGHVREVAPANMVSDPNAGFKSSR
jgi:hypothetical protein